MVDMDRKGPWRSLGRRRVIVSDDRSVERWIEAICHSRSHLERVMHGAYEGAAVHGLVVESGWKGQQWLEGLREGCPGTAAT